MSPKTRSLLATLLLVACVVTLLMRHELFARTTIGIAVQVAAALLMLWARLTFGLRSFHAAATPTAGGLVTSGPYRYWRHPIYAAILFALWAGVLSQGHAPTTASLLLAAGATLMTAVRIHAEETLLRTTFSGYDAYAARTKRIIPFVF